MLIHVYAGWYSPCTAGWYSPCTRLRSLRSIFGEGLELRDTYSVTIMSYAILTITVLQIANLQHESGNGDEPRGTCGSYAAAHNDVCFEGYMLNSAFEEGTLS